MGYQYFKRPLQLPDGFIPTADLADLAVTTAKLNANAVTSAKLGTNILQQATGTISVANITGTSAGQLGHAQGVELVAAQGAHNVIELISVVAIYDFITAAYTGGGNVTVNIGSGGAALTGLVSAANSFAAAADKVVTFYPLSTAGVALTENVGVNLVAASAFTQPGTAAGVIRWVINYRVHATGL